MQQTILFAWKFVIWKCVNFVRESWLLLGSEQDSLFFNQSVHHQTFHQHSALIKHEASEVGLPGFITTE